MARAAMDSLEGVDRMMMSGTRATLVLSSGSKLSADDVKSALEEQGLKFESFDKQQLRRPSAAFVASTPKFT
ncbi:MAG: aspartokinase [Planctomycetota bacterium]|jgi:aspartokinase